MGWRVEWLPAQARFRQPSPISPFRRKIPSFSKDAMTARDARVQFCVLLRRKRPGEREKELTMFLFYNSVFRKKSVPAEGVHIGWCDRSLN